MQPILESFVLVAVSEMGDKTQLLALTLAARFRKPLIVMAGILVATVFNHLLASFGGAALTHAIPPAALRWGLAATFIGFGVWLLVPDEDEELRESKGWGPFMTTAVAFFFAEMGDKTQLATIALGARFAAPVSVTLGTTLGMLLADGLAVFFGHRLTGRLPMVWIHRAASALFIVFGLGILLRG